MNSRYILVVLVVLATACGSTSRSTSSSAQPAGVPASIAWNGVDQRMVIGALIHNLNSTSTQRLDSSTYYFAGSHWAKADPSAAVPIVLSGHGELVYDSDRHREVYVVGPDPMMLPTQSQAVYESAGQGWTRVSTAHQLPPMAQWASAAYSPDLRAVVLIDGNSSGGQYSGRTWLFDGADWRSVSTPHWPGIFGYLNYDPTRHRVVGLSGQYVTWQFDGRDWSEVQLDDSSTPAVQTGMGRQSPGVAFDQRLGHWLVFGGTDGLQYLADTWIGDGSGWTMLTPSASPTPRATWPGRSNMAWDPADSTILLFGGEGGDKGPDLADTWSWDGSQWRQLAGPAYPYPTPSPTSPATASSARTPAPALPVPIPEALGLKCTLPVALAGDMLPNRMNPDRGALIDFASGTLKADPAGYMSWDAQHPNNIDTVAAPVLRGATGITYDRQLARWVPSRGKTIKPDGTAYAYATPVTEPAGPSTPNQIHLVDVATAQDRIVYTSKTTDVPIGFTAAGIYLVHQQWEALSVGLWLLDPATGQLTTISTSGTWWVVDGTAAWGFAGTWKGLGSPIQSVDRLDLKTGQTSRWLTASGDDSLWVQDLDAAGRPIVQVSVLTDSTVRYVLLVAANSAQSLFSFDSTYASLLAVDQDGIWLTGRLGLYLFSGGKLHYAFADTPGLQILHAAGACQ